MPDRFVVLGSNSFSGSHFLHAALLEGADVIGISRSEEPILPFLPYKWESAGSFRGHFQFRKLDLNLDIDEITETISEFKPDYVVNFAAQGMVAQSWDCPEDWYRTNVLANVRLHDRLRKCSFLKKYVHVSTPEVYGNCEGTVKEDAIFNPSTPYAVSRAACDMHLLSFHRHYGFPVVFTRAANVYGPGQQLYRIIPRTVLYARLGRSLQLHGGGRSIRSFIHIRDVVSATLKVARVASPPEIYHLSTGTLVSIHDLVAMICRIVGVEFDSMVEIVSDRPGKDAAYRLDSSKARQKLGWQDRISLEDGIRETVDWVDNNLEQLKEQPLEYVHKR